MPVIDIEYLPRISPVHRLNPFVLIVFELCVATIAALFNSPLALAVLIVAICGVIAAARVPVKKFKYMWVTLGVSVLFVFTQGIWFTSFGALVDAHFKPTVLFDLWPNWMPGGPAIPFTLEGTIFGLALGMRFCAIALAFPLLVMTVHPADLTNALARVRVLGRRLPPNFIFIFVNALRYVPTISKQFDETMDAQRARGVEFDRGGPIRRIKALFAILIPVVTTSLVGARDLTLALETRAFGAVAERTFLRAVLMRKADVAVIVVLILLTLALVYLQDTTHFGSLSYTVGIL
jgi:energy-coupling factor transport system permease protein